MTFWILQLFSLQNRQNSNPGFAQSVLFFNRGFGARRPKYKNTHSHSAIREDTRMGIGAMGGTYLIFGMQGSCGAGLKQIAVGIARKGDAGGDVVPVVLTKTAISSGGIATIATAGTCFLPCTVSNAIVN